jgi:hypothetical protein
LTASAALAITRQQGSQNQKIRFSQKKRAINYKTIKNIFSALHNFDFKKNVIGETRLGGFKKTSQIRPV